MGASDRATGSALLLFSGLAFFYYTVWAIILPFFGTSNPVHSWFPSREWAVRIPAFLIVLGTSGIGSLLGLRIVASPRRLGEKSVMAPTPPRRQM